jgi:hypothetical protein
MARNRKKATKGNQLLELLVRSASDLFPRYIILLNDAAGRVLRVLSKGPLEIYSIPDPVFLSMNLCEYFKFNPADLPNIHDTAGFNSIKNPPIPHFSEGFYTSLYLTSLHSIRIDRDRYVSIMSLRDILPNMIPREMNYFLYLDSDKDTIIGFNHGFFDLFAGVYSSPAEILSLPAGHVFTPSPASFQAVPDAASHIETGGRDAGVIYEKDLSKSKIGPDEDLHSAGNPKAVEGGLLWRHDTGTPLTITFLKTIDTCKDDFIFSVTVTSRRGCLPILSLGRRDRPESKRLPGDETYTAGRAFRRGNVLIKRGGLLAACKDDPGIPGHAVELSLVKRGSVLSLFQDRRPLVSYADQDFLADREACVSLGLRKGYECIIHKVSLRVFKADKKARQKKRRWIVRLNHSPHLSFTLDRIYNTALNTYPFYRVAAYLLTNITEMQERMQSLDQKYQVQVQREKELLTLLQERHERSDLFVGSGSTLSRIKEQAETIAASDARSVLVQGPTGSGKEVLAKYLHNASHRKNRPFVKVDCSTLPPELIESQLFGHEKGAFTGAISRFEGAFKQAQGGTLFLDEISNIGLNAQAKLLQFLNDFTVVPLGGKTPLRLDIRCIVASNKALAEEVRKGNFREDLYYRINAMTLNLPPLKDRKEDLPELSNYFIRLFGSANRKNPLQS